MNIDINFDNKLVNINGTEINATQYLKQQETIPEKPLNIVNIDIDFKDLPEKYKTYQLCLKMFFKSNNKDYMNEELKSVSRLIETAGKYANIDNLSLKDYLSVKYGLVENTINLFICQLIKIKMESLLAFIVSSGFFDFRMHMLHSGAILSGSCLLQQFYGKDYNSDYDIFVNKSKSTGLITFFTGIGTLQLNENTNNYKKIGSNGEIVNDEQYTKINNGSNKKMIENVHTFIVKSCYKVQLIVVNDDIPAKEFIEKDFDIDICKNMFWYDSLLPSVSFNNIHNLILKKAKFTNSKESNETMEKRKRKYLDRGFIFEEPVTNPKFVIAPWLQFAIAPDSELNKA